MLVTVSRPGSQRFPATVIGASPPDPENRGCGPARSAQEWKVQRDVMLPEGKVTIPGVLGATARYTEPVGQEIVIVGGHCGPGTSAWGGSVETSIAWAKLQAMPVEARQESGELWQPVNPELCPPGKAHRPPPHCSPAP